MKKNAILVLLLSIYFHGAMAQQEYDEKSKVVFTNSLWDNWFGQLGMDMSLMNPYGVNFKNTFPNGKTFGVDLAVGKQFTPEIATRFKINWENGIVKNNHSTWAKNAYLFFAGDVLLNIHSLLDEYNPDRKWNLNVYPRMGAFIRLNDGEGSPILGLGINNTYKLSDKWSVYGDVAYQVVSAAHGFSTGRGTGNNGFFDINIGAQIDLGYNKFQKANTKPARYEKAVVTTSLWSNWFAQAGLGMSLLNLYGTNFDHVFPNGKTLGLNFALGKMFSPEMGLRGGINWQNGIIGNNHLNWLDEDGHPGSNHDGGGYGSAYLDVLFNLHNMFSGYDSDRTWNTTIFPRAGIASNFELGGGSPLVGLGTEQSFKLNDRLKLFVDFAYNFTTSEIARPENNTNNGGSPGSSNGWFDLNVGVQIELGRSSGKFHKIVQ